jgi:hypothetical protein
MLLLKLGLIAFTVGLSSLAARRGGHLLAGLVTGLPVIVGPILALVLWEHGSQRTAELALATLVCVPATLVHSVVFAHLAGRAPWPGCLAVATLAYLAVAAVLSLWTWPLLVVVALALVAPRLGMWAMPRRAASAPAAVVRIPATEVLWRMAAAVAMAAAILWGAAHLPAAVNGVLLAIPIAGAVLPCFTLPVYGVDATRALLHGFARGLQGFVVFFVVLTLALSHPGAAQAPQTGWAGGWPWLAFGLALCATGGVAWALNRARRSP